jgi:hypothetical protein
LPVGSGILTGAIELRSTLTVRITIQFSSPSLINVE